MVKNSVSRTPAQMAAFVGNHNCVSTINSFVDRKDVEYFSVPQGLDEAPKMDPMCVTSVHNLIMQVIFLALIYSRNNKIITKSISNVSASVLCCR